MKIKTPKPINLVGISKLHTEDKIVLMKKTYITMLNTMILTMGLQQLQDVQRKYSNMMGLKVKSLKDNQSLKNF